MKSELQKDFMDYLVHLFTKMYDLCTQISTDIVKNKTRKVFIKQSF